MMRNSLIKQRANSQKILQTLDSFHTLKSKARVPVKFRKRVRKSKKTTFIYPNKSSFRVICKDDKFHSFITKFKDLYSTSANLTTKSFDMDFAFKNSDIIVYTKDEFSEKNSSSIYELNKKKIRKIR